jgi:putative aminopeptidase FrvX
MASLKSRKALHEALKTIPGATVPKTPKHFSNETYGKRSMIYVRFTDTVTRRAGQIALEDLGFKVGRSYAPDGPVTEVQVSYFKGWHWDE